MPLHPRRDRHSATPPREQHDEDRRRGEIRGGAGVGGVARVAQREIHLVDRAAARRRADAAGRKRGARALRHLRRERRAAAAGDVRVRCRREQGEERLDDRVVPGQTVAARPVERRRAGLERDLERRSRTRARSRPGRPPAASRRAASSSVRRRRPARPRVPSPPGARTANRRVDVAGVVDGGRRRAPRRTPRAKADRRFLKRRARERRQQQHDAEIRVRARPSRRRFDGEAHGRAERRVAGAGQRRADRGGAGEEVLVARVGEVTARRHVARLRRADLEEAGELRRAADVGRARRFARDRRVDLVTRSTRDCLVTDRDMRVASRSCRELRAAIGRRARAHASGQMVHDRAGDVDPGRLLQALPAGDAVDFEHEHRAVARREQIHAGVVGADRRRRAQRELLPRRRQIERPRRSADATRWCASRRPAPAARSRRPPGRRRRRRARRGRRDRRRAARRTRRAAARAPARRGTRRRDRSRAPCRAPSSRRSA